MAPNPLACSHRINIPITVDGLLHEQRLLTVATPGGVDYQLVHQLSADQDWQDDIEHFLGLLMALYTPLATVGTVTLEQLAFGAYLPISTYAPTANVGTGAAPYVPASQFTWVFFDMLFRKVRLNFMETRYSNPFHNTVYTASGAPVSALGSDIFAPSGVNDTGFWLRSRSEQFIRGFTSITVTDNNRIRRDRGII